MSDEQSSEGQRPDPWAAWSADPGQPDQPGGEPGQGADPSPGAQPGSSAQPGYGQPGSPPPPPPPGFGYPGSHTQPQGFAQQNQYGQPGYGQPGYDPYHPYGQPPNYGYPGPARRRRRASNLIAYLAVAIVAAVVGGLFVDLATGTSSPPSANSGNPGNNGPFSGLPINNGNSANNHSGLSGGTVKKVQNAIMPGLVVISSNLQYQDDAAEATGMVISSNGLVLTNNHVINGTTGLTARVVNSNGQGTGKPYVARWLGYDKTADVAVIQLVGASGLRTVPLGNSNDVKVGDGVVAMGNANGTGSITTVEGRVTGLNQKITASDNGESSETLTNMIQTSSDIIPGDSGGPLASENGQVIGMDTAASTDSLGSQEDVGFAIPINRAMSIADQIINGKASSTVRIGSVGFLGVVVVGGTSNKLGAQSTLTNPQQQATQEQQQLQQAGGGGFGSSPSTGCLTNDGNITVPTSIAPVNSGTLVLGALCGTPAAGARIVPGDVITNVDGRSVSSPASLVTILSILKSGQTVPVTWVTPSGSTMNQSMDLAAAPPE